MVGAEWVDSSRERRKGRAGKGAASTLQSANGVAGMRALHGSASSQSLVGGMHGSASSQSLTGHTAGGGMGYNGTAASDAFGGQAGLDAAIRGMMIGLGVNPDSPDALSEYAMKISMLEM